jgi:periplasmic divalent cation tolerance protein
MFRNLRLVYITTSGKEEARKIGEALVKEELAACVNIIDGMESVYRWKGDIVSDSETILIAKTTYSNVARITRKVKELHSYEVPCVVSFNMAEQEGNEEYLNWLMSSVKPPLSGDEELSS